MREILRLPVIQTDTLTACTVAHNTPAVHNTAMYILLGYSRLSLDFGSGHHAYIFILIGHTP